MLEAGSADQQTSLAWGGERDKVSAYSHTKCDSTNKEVVRGKFFILY